MTDTYYQTQLGNRNMCRDMFFYRETSLFVSALVRGARRYAARLNHGHIHQLILNDEMWALPDEWSFPDELVYLLNGETIISEFTWNKVTLNVTIGRVETVQVASVPDWLNWEWDPMCECLHLNSFHYMSMHTPVAALYLPSLCLDSIPGDIVMQLNPWVQVRSLGGVVMSDINWWRYTPEGGKWNRGNAREGLLTWDIHHY